MTDTSRPVPEAAGSGGLPDAAGTPASSIPGLRYRRLDAPADYPRMNEIANDVRIAQGDDFYTSDEQFQRFYERIENCDVARDLVLVELRERLVGYVRVGWHDEPASRLYAPIVFPEPAAQTLAILTELYAVADRRVAEIAAGHPRGPKLARIGASAGLPE